MPNKTRSEGDALGRRTFLTTASAGLVFLAVGCDTSDEQGRDPGEPASKLRERPEAADGQGVYIYRLSVRGRRAPQSLKRHAANKRFATREAAQQGLPYPSAPARVVKVVVHQRKYDHWFADGDTVDLRHLPHRPPNSASTFAAPSSSAG